MMLGIFSCDFWASYIFFDEAYFQMFCPFIIVLVAYLLLSCKNSLYILGQFFFRHVYWIDFHLFCGLGFIFCNSVFWRAKKNFNFCRVQFMNHFPFYSSCFCFANIFSYLFFYKCYSFSFYISLWSTLGW